MFGDRLSLQTPCFRRKPARESRQTDHAPLPNAMAWDCGEMQAQKHINWFQKLLLFIGFGLIVGLFFEYFHLFVDDRSFLVLSCRGAGRVYIGIALLRASGRGQGGGQRARVTARH